MMNDHDHWVEKEKIALNTFYFLSIFELIQRARGVSILRIFIDRELSKRGATSFRFSSLVDSLLWNVGLSTTLFGILK